MKLHSVLVDTGCVPDWMYAVSFFVLGVIIHHMWRARSRQSAG